MSTIPTQNPVPSETAKDLKFNSGKIDEFVTSMKNKYIDRFGQEHFTIEGLRWVAQQAISQFGYITLDSFQKGAEITLPNQVLRDEITGEYYRWDGALPKSVQIGSTPDSSGGVGIGKWISVGDASVRSDLIKPTGASMIGANNGNTVQYEIDKINSSNMGSVSATYRVKNLKLLGLANKKLKSGDDLKIVCVGDSITAGYDVNSTDKVPADNGDWATHAPIQYPLQVQNQLNFYTSSLTKVINRGYSGDTAKACFNRWNTSPNAHVAHIMLGINDAATGSGTTFEEYLDYMERLIKRYVDWGCGVVLHTVTAKTFNNIDDPSTHFTQSLRILAEVYGCPVFESEEVHQFRLFSSVYSDGTHFNKAGYALYGDAVVSFILSGGWVGQYRKINSLTNIQTGRSTEGIGFFSKGIILGTDITNSYLTNGSLGRSPAGELSIVSYHFYMDCDVANIEIIGNIEDGVISPSRTYDNNGSDINRLTLKSNKNHKVFETTNYIVNKGRTGVGREALAGVLVGRGWKTISIKFEDTIAERYIQGLVFKPIDDAKSTQFNHNGFTTGKDDILVAQLPYYDYDQSSFIPPKPINLIGDYFFPLPDGMYPFAGPSGSFFDSAPVYVTVEVFGSSDTIRNPNGITQFILRRGGTTTTLIIEKIYSTAENSIIPLSAGVGSSAYEGNDLYQINVDKSSYPSTTKQGWLWMTFNQAESTAYYRIEIRCVGKMAQSSWGA
ncbi:GDSL-type esterase/lipase family protein [Proteus penneri]|uniref:tail fiber/spike domain-containing protein n=1 Tax=Proteus penneri TaxID=102862 RepID=UPI00288BE8FD|nr:GDSL-type esterase/lipase family protein [Proteus penneri]